MEKLTKLLGQTDQKIFIPLLLGVALVMGIFCLFLIFVPSVRPVATEEPRAVPAGQPAVDPAQVENEYKAKTAQALKAYASLSGGAELDAAEIERIRNELLALKVPTQFRSLHLDLVMAMARLKVFIDDGKQEDRAAAEKAILEAKREFAWLN